MGTGGWACLGERVSHESVTEQIKVSLGKDSA